MLQDKEPTILTSSQFHRRTNQSRFVVILADAPPGTGIILRSVQQA